MHSKTVAIALMAMTTIGINSKFDLAQAANLEPGICGNQSDSGQDFPCFKITLTNQDCAKAPETDQQIGTVIQGIAFRKSVCQNALELISRGYICQSYVSEVDLEGNVNSQKIGVMVSKRVTCKQGEATVFIGSYDSVDLYEAGFGKALFDLEPSPTARIVTNDQLKAIWEENKAAFFQAQTKEVYFDCVALNVCASSARDLAQTIVDNFQGTNLQIDIDGNVTGNTAFGEFVEIKTAVNSPHLLLRRGTLDQYRVGGIKLQ